MLKIKRFAELLHQTWDTWTSERAAQLGAALAYYAIFSIGPLLLVTVTIAGIFSDRDFLRSDLFASLTDLFGEQPANFIKTLATEARKKVSGGLTAFFAITVLLYASIKLFVHLKNALNSIWGIRVEKYKNLRSFFKKYLVSIAAVLSTALLLLVSFISSTLLSALEDFIISWLPLSKIFLAVVNLSISAILITALFALMYRFLLEKKVAWQFIFPGALLAASLFFIGKSAISLYLSKVAFASTYGTASSLVILLIWIYFSAQTFLLGATFNYVYWCANNESAQECKKI